jgi:hypothetical protein
MILNAYKIPKYHRGELGTEKNITNTPPNGVLLMRTVRIDYLSPPLKWKEGGIRVDSSR